jgi:hypothetical protein
MRALALLHRARHAWRVRWLRSRRAQLLQGIETLDKCIWHDQALVQHMQRELLVIDSRLARQAQSQPTLKESL